MNAPSHQSTEDVPADPPECEDGDHDFRVVDYDPSVGLFGHLECRDCGKEEAWDGVSYCGEDDYEPAPESALADMLDDLEHEEDPRE